MVIKKIYSPPKGFRVKKVHKTALGGAVIEIYKPRKKRRKR